MKLFEIEGQSLRLMFADSDVQFSEEEFENGSLRKNGNTRDKLVRMPDSIRRAIDLYYQYVGTRSLIFQKHLSSTVSGGATSYGNSIDLSSEDGVYFPSRVDLLQNTEGRIFGRQSVNFYYDFPSKKIIFIDADYSQYGSAISFNVYCKASKENIPLGADELTFDLDSLGLPGDMQRQIPLYVKSELYEEDEYNLAELARNEYIRFLQDAQSDGHFSNVQTKVKNTFPKDSQ